MGFVVVQDNAPDQRQGAGSVIRQPDDDLLPGDPGPAEKVDVLCYPLDIAAMAARQLLDLLDRNWVHASTGFRRTFAQRERHHTFGLQQRDEFSKSARAHTGRDEHPHRVHQDEVERQTGPERSRHVRQAVRDQLETGVRVPAAQFLTHHRVGLYCNHIVAEG